MTPHEMESPREPAGGKGTRWLSLPMIVLSAVSLIVMGVWLQGLTRAPDPIVPEKPAVNAPRK